MAPTPLRTRSPRTWLRALPLVAVVLAGLLAVPAPAVAADRLTLAADAFERTVTGGLGTADQGGAWTTSGTAASFAVSGGRATVTNSPGRTTQAVLPAVTTTDAQVAATLSLPRLPSGGPVYAGLVSRQVGGTSYLGRVVVGTSGSVTLQLLVSGTTVASTRLTAGLSADTPLRLRVEATGSAPTTLRARAWPASGVEPTGWQLTTTDATPALQTAGSAGLQYYLSSSATGPVALGVDDLAVSTVASAPPPNQPPTASFTATTNGLTAAFDASASADPDGTIADRRWDLGDGTTAAGTTPTRTYASTGTYQVTLTVTDDDGSTTSTTRPVTVTAPPPPTTTQAADAFSRTASSGWGAADQGGAWSIAGGASALAVDGARGTMTVGPGRTVTAGLMGLSSTDADVSVTLGLPQLPPSGASSYSSVLARQTTSGGYAARVVVNSAGAVNLYLNSGGTTLAVARLPFTLAAGGQVRARVQVTGTNPTTLRARAWPVTTAEPTRWTLTATDTASGLQAPGWVAISQYTSSAAPAPLTLTVDDLTVSGTSSGTPGRPTQAQWLADVDAAMAGGLAYLDAQVGTVAAPAIVLDVDNTSLQSYYQPFAATPAVLAFAERARADGFAVFIVTGRSADTGGTASQLSRAGYVVDGICFRDPALSGQASKEACRTARAAQGYTIVANVGNREADLVGSNSGRTFRLPDYGFLD